MQGSEATVHNRHNWTPGYPRSDPSSVSIMLRVMSSLFLYFGNEEGYINVDDKAIGYPLCSYVPGMLDPVEMFYII